MKNLANFVNKTSSMEHMVTFSTDMVDLVFDPFESFIQIGIGGEWWSGKVKFGRTTLHHKKEKIDEAYLPVNLTIKNGGEGLFFEINGGFLDSGERFHLNFTEG